jgi:antitoxin YefM
MKTVKFSETNNDLRALLELATCETEGVRVVRDDGAEFVMLSAGEYRGLKETAYLLSSPANALHLAQSLAEFKVGKVVKHELTEASDPDAQPPVHE